MLKTILRNAVSNWMGYAVHAAVTFFLTPFVLSNLGGSRYGIWVLVVSLSGYYGLLDLGFRSGMTQYMTRYLATRDFHRLNQTASTAFVALSLCGGLVAVCTLVLASVVSQIFVIPAENIYETQWSMRVIGLSIAIQFAYYPFSTVFAATQRYDLANGVAIAARLLGAVGTYLALKAGYGLVGISVIYAAADQLSYICRWRLAYLILPELVVSPRLASRAMLRPILAFGFWSAIVVSANRLKSGAAMILIGVLLPIAAIAPYAIALGLAGQLNAIVAPLAIVLFPAVTALDAKGNMVALRRLFLHASRAILLLSIAAAVVSSLLAADFFRLWIGTRLGEASNWPAPAVIYYPLAAAAVCAASQRVGFQVFFGTRRVSQLSYVLVIQSAAEVVLIAVLITYVGLVGVSMGVLFSTAVFDMILLPTLICRCLHISVRQYLRNVWLRPALTLLLLLPMAWLAAHWLPASGSWWEFFVFAVIAGLGAMFVVVMVGLDATERWRFVVIPFLGIARAASGVGIVVWRTVVRRQVSSQDDASAIDLP